MTINTWSWQQYSKNAVGCPGIIHLMMSELTAGLTMATAASHCFPHYLWRSPQLFWGMWLGRTSHQTSRNKLAAANPFSAVHTCWSCIPQIRAKHCRAIITFLKGLFVSYKCRKHLIRGKLLIQIFLCSFTGGRLHASMVSAVPGQGPQPGDSWHCYRCSWYPAKKQAEIPLELWQDAPVSPSSI